ncbi:MAG: hypothetical protein OEZ01_11060, partial [Candidatus Heimdallarchaeota archaeon]|nr:hypothetical protein [Candidatus Heimdallarchaeota archaeon]
DIPLNTQLNLTLIDDDFFNFTLTEDSYLKFSVESSNVGIELFAKLYNENNTDFAVIYNNHSDFHSQGKYTIQIGLFDQIDYIATINYTLSIKLIQPQPLSTTEILEQEINEFNYFTITTEVDARFELIIHRSDNSEYTIVLIPIIRTSRIVWDIIDYKVEGQYLYHKLTAIIEPGECIIKMHTYYENTIPYSVEYNITELVDDDDDSYETANLISDTTSIEDELYSTEYNIEHDLYFFDLTQTTNILIVLDFPYTTSMDIEVTDINFQSEELSISYRSGIITMVGVLNMGRYYIDIFSEENLNIYTLYFEELITNQIPSGYYTDQTYINHLQLGFSFLFTIETTTQFTIGYYYFINYYLLGSNTYQVYYIPPYEIIDLPPDVYYLSLSIHPDFFKLLREGNEFLINIIISMSVNLTPSQPPVNSGTSSQPINPNAPENRNTEDIEPLGVNISTTSLICGISVIIYMKRRILIKY